jgi:hypothetical protein
MSSTNKAQPRRHWLLQCSACHKVIDCSQADLDAYVQNGWPHCCGRIMTLFAQAPRPGPDRQPPGSGSDD